MARGRMISKSLSTSEKFAALVERAGPLAEFCQTLYLLLVPHTDDFGRLQGDAFTVKHVVHPSSPRTLAEFRAALQQLDAVALVQLYTVKQKIYLQIEHFDDHQQGLHKRTRSQCPAPPHGGNGSGTFPEGPGKSGLIEEKRREEKRSTPLPPLQGGRARKRRHDIPAGGNCPHDERCSSTRACVAKTIAEGRKAAS